MAKPWIGILTRYYDSNDAVGQNRDYLDAIVWAGGLPLLIPAESSAEALQEYAAQLSGILLPGNPSDVDPAHYSAAPHPKLRRIYPERDAADFALIRFAEVRDIPLLGICFGLQSLNVSRGGTLLQDIAALIEGAVPHEGGEVPARHAVEVDTDGLLARCAQARAVEVNSYHHQAVDRPGRNLRVVARSADGVIEALEDPDRRFVVGVQWHPERGWTDDALSQRLFRAFVRESEKSK